MKNTRLLLIAVLFFYSCGTKTTKSIRNMDFMSDWRFVEDSLIDASAVDYDATSWMRVDLPHDWSLTDYQVQDSLHIGPFYKNLPLGHDVGYLRGGTGWYRKEFVIEEANHGKRVILHFDGVHSQSTLWVNGKEVGQHVYGYTPFYFDITPLLNETGQANTITMKVVKPTQDSRWFTGAGIYRQVTISYLEPVHISPWGVAVKANVEEGGPASVQLTINVENNTVTAADLEVEVAILAPEGEEVVTGDTSVTVAALENHQLSIALNVAEPQLWGMDKPVLYNALVRLKRDGEIIDGYVQPFGIRAISYSADNGFLLNGKPVELKGGCMHHDNGLLGAAAFRAAEERRVQTMKANGFNAIRTSHNPPSQYFLDACDKYGMLVIDESFDMWIKPKRPNDYHNYYEEWWQKDLTAMILRDRNHPSIIMWSFGNEVQERADSAGLEISKNCISLIKSLDNTRPITEAICGFWDNPGKVWDDTAPAFALLDVGGYNYQWAVYESDHEKYPQRIMFGSESVPKEAFRNWQMVEQHPWVIGDFVWTGMDYIGESGIGYSIYPKPADQRTFLMPWPTYVSWCGDIDITGNKKPQSYYRDVLWGESNLEILVHEPIADGAKEATSWWGWPNEEPHWNWESNEGKPMEVQVFSSWPRIRLELNGEVVGEKEATDSLKVAFQVPWQAGVLRAVALKDGKEMDVKELVTAGTIKSLKIQAETETLTAGAAEIAYIQVEAVDANGNLVPTAGNLLTVTVDGEATLLAAGNANPLVEGSLTDGSFRFFRGKALVIIRSTGKTGIINVTVKGDEDLSATISLSATDN